MNVGIYSNKFSSKKLTRYGLAKNSSITPLATKNIIHEIVKDNLLSTVILIASGFDMTISKFLDSPLFVKKI